VGNLARPLTGHQNHLERGADHAGSAELLPERRHLCVAQHALAAAGAVALDARARIGGDAAVVLAESPREYCACAREYLIGEHWRCDPRAERPNVVARDAGGGQLTPSREKMSADEPVGLSPRLVPPHGVLAVPRGHVRERAGVAQRAALALG